MRKKKAQMEIMGLAIIVVLLVLGMLFAIKYVLFKPQTDYRGEYTKTQLAANLLNSIVNTNTECNQITISGLLQDAARTQPLIYCGNIPSKDYVKNVTINILNQTLNNSKLEYYFSAGTQNNPNVVVIGTRDNNRVRETKIQPLPTDEGTMTITLDLYS